MLPLMDKLLTPARLYDCHKSWTGLGIWQTGRKDVTDCCSQHCIWTRLLRFWRLCHFWRCRQMTSA